MNEIEILATIELGGLLCQVFNSIELEQWMSTSNILLKGGTPLSWITGGKAQKLLEIVKQDKAFQ